MDVRTPTKDSRIAVIEKLTEENFEMAFRPVLDEIIKKKVTGVVVDLSNFPQETRIVWLPFIDGTLIASNLERMYVGVTIDDLGVTDYSFERHIYPKISKDLDSAVKGLLKK